MEILSREKARLYNPLALAYFGDSVYELFVRQMTILKGNDKASKLHGTAVAKVSAVYQSKAISRIENMLSEEETDIYKRGRNASSQVPRSAKPSEYRRATGLEALFGYLFLIGEIYRIEELFEVVYNVEENS